MCKKFLIAGVAVALGLLVVKKTEVGSHLRAWWRDARTTVENSIPIPNEIERLRGEIARLDDVYRTQFHPVAVESVSVENLKKEIAEIEKKLDKQKADIQTMKTDLESNTAFIVYGDVKYSRKRVESDLAHRFEAYKTCEAGLKAKKDLLEAKEEKLAQAMNKLEGMKNAKVEMEAELARLEADYAGVVALKEKNNFQIDDSALSRIKTSMARLQERVKVEKKECDLAGLFAPAVNPTVQKVEKRDLLKEIDEHFGSPAVKVEGKVAAGN
jgi:chromosome segregation ATPase